ncbi:MAG: protein-L-isoaspartate(D-aspartate) O-methyltransferase [Planctomycetota bacterium]|jgi:protein-L-isoaspartate(D-aspartate) O-methyltransferase
MRCVLVILLGTIALAQDKPKPPRSIPADWPPSHEKDTQVENRRWMVRTQLVKRDITSDTVLAAMRAVPRHQFVPVGMRKYAYEDRPLAIGYDQTISQPYVVASMTEELAVKTGDKVLEIGTGSGYQAAVLGRLTPWVYSIEIKKPLHVRAKATLKKLGYSTIETRHGDGYYGWPVTAEAPFDAIMVTAAVPHVPPPLVKQLKKGGRMILPVGDPFAVQDLRLVTKDEKGRVRTKSLYAVRFVPLTGSLGKKK